MVVCLELGADLHVPRLMPLPLTVSCFNKIQIGFTFLVPAHPGSPGQRAVKRVCVYMGTLHHLQCICDYEQHARRSGGFVLLLAKMFNYRKFMKKCVSYRIHNT